jgi:hypothetical protein
VRHLVLFAVLLAAPVARATDLGPDSWALAYYGDFLTHPGALGRAEWDLDAGDRGGLVLEAEVGTYWHPENMVATFARVGPALRWDWQRGTRLGIFAHAGGEWGAWATPSFRVVEGGDVHRAFLSGDTWVLAAAGVDVGHRVRGDTFDAWFVRPQLGLRIPTFYGAGIDLAVEGGLRF